MVLVSYLNAAVPIVTLASSPEIYNFAHIV